MYVCWWEVVYSSLSLLRNTHTDKLQIPHKHLSFSFDVGTFQGNSSSQKEEIEQIQFFVYHFLLPKQYYSVRCWAGCWIGLDLCFCYSHGSYQASSRYVHLPIYVLQKHPQNCVKRNTLFCCRLRFCLLANRFLLYLENKSLGNCQHGPCCSIFLSFQIFPWTFGEH